MFVALDQNVCDGRLYDVPAVLQGASLVPRDTPALACAWRHRAPGLRSCRPIGAVPAGRVRNVGQCALDPWPS